MACILCVLNPGCLLGAIAFTRHERLHTSEIATRPAPRPADVDGQLCYVDREVRVDERTRIDSWWGLGGGTDALIFGMASGAGADWWGPALAIDGVLAFTYFAWRNRKETSSVHWEETLDTTSCAH